METINIRFRKINAIKALQEFCLANYKAWPGLLEAKRFVDLMEDESNFQHEAGPIIEAVRVSRLSMDRVKEAVNIGFNQRF